MVVLGRFILEVEICRVGVKCWIYVFFSGSNFGRSDIEVDILVVVGKIY